MAGIGFNRRTIQASIADPGIISQTFFNLTVDGLVFLARDGPDIHRKDRAFRHDIDGGTAGNRAIFRVGAPRMGWRGIGKERDCS